MDRRRRRRRKREGRRGKREGTGRKNQRGRKNGKGRKEKGGIRGKEVEHDWHSSWGESCLLVLRGMDALVSGSASMQGCKLLVAQ